MRARLGCWAVGDTTGRNGIEPKKSGSQVSRRIWDLDVLAVHLEGTVKNGCVGSGAHSPAAEEKTRLRSLESRSLL